MLDFFWLQNFENKIMKNSTILLNFFVLFFVLAQKSFKINKIINLNALLSMNYKKTKK
jgi:hypothetical protein